jgi:hypothetical protein
MLKGDDVHLDGPVTAQTENLTVASIENRLLFRRFPVLSRPAICAASTSRERLKNMTSPQLATASREMRQAKSTMNVPRFVIFFARISDPASGGRIYAATERFIKGKTSLKYPTSVGFQTNV